MIRWVLAVLLLSSTTAAAQTPGYGPEAPAAAGGSTVSVHHFGLSANDAVATGGSVGWDVQAPAAVLTLAGGVITIPAGSTALLVASIGPGDGTGGSGRIDLMWYDVTGAAVAIGNSGSSYPPSSSGTRMRAPGGASAFVDATAGAVDVEVRSVFSDGGFTAGAGWSFATVTLIQ